MYLTVVNASWVWNPSDVCTMRLHTIKHCHRVFGCAKSDWSPTFSPDLNLCDFSVFPTNLNLPIYLPEEKNYEMPFSVQFIHTMYIMNVPTKQYDNMRRTKGLKMIKWRKKQPTFIIFGTSLWCGRRKRHLRRFVFILFSEAK